MAKTIAATIERDAKKWAPVFRRKSRDNKTLRDAKKWAPVFCRKSRDNKTFAGCEKVGTGFSRKIPRQQNISGWCARRSGDIGIRVATTLELGERGRDRTARKI